MPGRKLPDVMVLSHKQPLSGKFRAMVKHDVISPCFVLLLVNHDNVGPHCN